ncbi:CBR-AVR-14 protein [Loa loa]|uniref:CBR-AVR-14 protein n=2 Tax=Loa loa TaxID=7209 RepID=A0A1S0UIU9_LOALO|nr:CBR-AVR-14 protein [Loa loa]EJD74807.1 CBR-AVR-14 protein [Loa loa]
MNACMICLNFTLLIVVVAKKKLKEQEIIQRTLKDYDWRVRPRGSNLSWPDTGGPVLVSVNIYLRSISKIDDVNMEYSAQFTFREEWNDARLAYGRLADENTQVPPFVVLAASEQADLTQQIWMPDTFFQNEKEARRHLIDKPNVLIRIHPDGQILYSVRLSLVLSCPMSLEYYPLDRQTCLIDLASYAYTTDDIKYEWKLTNPIQQKEGLRQSLPSFELQDVLTDYCTSKTNTGEYSCLRTKMILRREFSYYLVQLYIPSLMLVIVSWVSFWLDKDSVPARVTLGVTTLLTMTTQNSGINAKLPPVSYTKAIDVWIGVCLAFIFGALLEFALVNYAARKDITTGHRMLPKYTNHMDYSSGYQPLVSATSAMTPSHFWWCFRPFVRRYRERSKRIDVVSRLVFPIGYACFNGEYSCARVMLLLRREYSYYLIQLYIPCIMLVVVSWVSFWLDKDAVPARVSLGVTTLLTMTTQASGINAKLPPVSYIKAVDVWIGACLIFIFGALLEYALVNYYGRQEFLKKERKKKTEFKGCLYSSNHLNQDLRQSLRLDMNTYRRKWWRKFRLNTYLCGNTEVSKRVDLISRLAFPTFFACFLGISKVEDETVIRTGVE